MNVSHLLGLAFLAWALSSWAFWSTAPDGFEQAWQLSLLALLFMVGARLGDMHGLLQGAAAGIGISSVMVILERFGVGPHSQPIWFSGLFGNGLYLAEFAAMVMAGLIAYRDKWAALLCVPSILLVGSLPRGPLVALIVAAVFWSANRWRTWILIASGPLIAFLIWLRPLSASVRLDLWTAMLPEITFRGHGLGAFFGDGPLFSVYRDYLTDGRPLHANNDLLEIGYDLGLVGLILALAFLASLIWPYPQYEFLTDESKAGLGIRDCWPAKLIVIVFLMEGLFGFPLHMPATAGLFALAAGYVAGQSSQKEKS